MGRRALVGLDGAWPYLVDLAIVLVAAFLVAPLVIVVLTSFNSVAVAFPPQTWSLQAYREIPESMYQAFYTSLKLGGVSVLIALLIGIPTALALVRSPIRGRGALQAFFRSPLQVPAIVSGVALYQYYVILGGFGVPIRGEFSGLVIAHVLITLPFVLATLVARVAVLDPTLEETSYGLGAGFLRTTFQVTLPLLRPAIVASAFLAFLVSFDDVAVSLFLVSTGATPLSVQLLFTAEQDLVPALYAVSTVVVVASLGVAVLIERLVGLRTVLSN